MISFSVASQASTDSGDLADWRDELKQKLQKHHLKKRRNQLGLKADAPLSKIAEPPATPEPEKPTPPSKPAPVERAGETGASESPGVDVPESEGAPRPPRVKSEPDRGEVVKQLFKYKLGDAGRLRDRRIITFSKGKAPSRPDVEDPSIRRSSEPSTPKPAADGPRQRQLALESPPAAEPPATPPPAESPAAGAPQRTHSVSAVETLFSRLLAGIIDVVLAGALGLGFVWVACYLAAVSFPSIDSLAVAVVCGWLLLVLNEAFFLFTLRRTPGMVWTELRLESESGGPVEFLAILLRSVLWLPVAATVVGLLWALVDERGRCLHDRLTGTVIVPAQD